MDEIHNKMIGIRSKNLQESKKVSPPPGFKVVNVLSWHQKDTPYYVMSPYCLKTDGNEDTWNPPGIIFENYWQSTKLYREVFDIEVFPHSAHRNNPNMLSWRYTCDNGLGREIHYDDAVGEVQNKYYEWRDSIWYCDKPIRHPNGRHRAKDTLFGVAVMRDTKTLVRFDYIEGRKLIYVPEYKRLVRQLPQYHQLLDDLRRGVQICITEVDLPAVGKKGLYGSLCDHNGIYTPTLETLHQLLEDPSEPFGHGLALMIALLEDLS